MASCDCSSKSRRRRERLRRTAVLKSKQLSNELNEVLYASSYYPDVFKMLPLNQLDMESCPQTFMPFHLGHNVDHVLACLGHFGGSVPAQGTDADSGTQRHHKFPSTKIEVPPRHCPREPQCADVLPEVPAPVSSSCVIATSEFGQQTQGSFSDPLFASELTQLVGDGIPVQLDEVCTPSHTTSFSSDALGDEVLDSTGSSASVSMKKSAEPTQPGSDDWQFLQDSLTPFISALRHQFDKDAYDNSMKPHIAIGDSTAARTQAISAVVDELVGALRSALESDKARTLIEKYEFRIRRLLKQEVNDMFAAIEDSCSGTSPDEVVYIYAEPKIPPAAYFLFMSRMKEEWKEEFSGPSAHEKWRQMSADQRKHYESEASTLRAAYELQRNEFRRHGHYKVLRSERAQGEPNK